MPNSSAGNCTGNIPGIASIGFPGLCLEGEQTMNVHPQQWDVKISDPYQTVRWEYVIQTETPHSQRK